MMPDVTTNAPWTRQQLLVAFRIYWGTPFGRLHRLNPDVVRLAQFLERTPSAVAMKTCNFASLDPHQKARNIKARGSVSQADRALWHEFLGNPESVAAEAEASYLARAGQEGERSPDGVVQPEGPTEQTRTVRTRRVMAYHREHVFRAD